MIQKPTFVTNRMPYDEENKHLSKSQFLAKMRAKQELDAKLKAYEQELKGEKKDELIAEQQKAEVKKPGRPKKVE